MMKRWENDWDKEENERDLDRMKRWWKKIKMMKKQEKD